ncbi:tRNA pseudouridine(38-40) synthase TruA [Deferribacter autotrophicus]|uniref:tRNA pseudouridine synthase A n=1 Tax=Deferribacter autotrophicus TaxID=500465 RepID=A0A5A8F909_9BACT|nr:tRNA pseudouridine(38-40) synthase TruA [Deferribacter autotrophicus]KAA0259541.1 tRNA pseudouridine(38-40) synthase TruA [Deferribacter autotrophicus]
MKVKKKCVVEYDGTNFYGWQRQKNVRTVQKVIEDALSKIYKAEIKIVGSGRTDTGVHALGQVFHFTASRYLENRSVLMGLNSILPDDVVIKKVDDVDNNFHAQKSAKSKTYLYKIYNHPVRSAIYRNRAWWIREEIRLEKFEELLNCFVGEKDFSAMCLKRSVPENPVRKINFVNISKEDTFINIEINANGFLHNMVRNIVGTVVDIYFNNGCVDDIEKILESRDREQAGRTAPAHGLYLKEVFY